MNQCALPVYDKCSAERVTKEQTSSFCDFIDLGYENTKLAYCLTDNICSFNICWEQKSPGYKPERARDRKTLPLKKSAG